MLQDENFTKSSYSKTMKEFERHRLIRQLNEKYSYSYLFMTSCIEKNVPWFVNLLIFDKRC
jgi:hypothetical protein